MDRHPVHHKNQYAINRPEPVFYSRPVLDRSFSSRPRPAGVPPLLYVDDPSLRYASSPLAHADAARAPVASSSPVLGAVAEGAGDKEMSEILNKKTP